MKCSNCGNIVMTKQIIGTAVLVGVALEWRYSVDGL